MQTLKEARKYAYDLVDQGKTQYHMLDDFEKSCLTGLIINSTDKMHIWEYITEADYKNELPVMLSEWLWTNSKELGNHLLETLRNNAVIYAAKESMRILEEQVQEWEIDRDYCGE
jgi:hypothetical protein